MVNAYITVDELKGKPRANYQTAVDDEQLLRFILAASRRVESHTKRNFFDYTETRVFDGSGTNRLYVHDLIAITTLKTDDDGDLVYEDTWATTDYFLRPNNADPTTRLNPRSRPYWEILVNPEGSYSSFPAGAQRVEIAGRWGYWSHVRRATETVNEELDASETEVDITARTDVEAGHTILVDSEQMFVQSHSGNTLTVIRGVNGTTAATHSNGAAVDIYEYPEGVVEATAILATHSIMGRGGNVTNVQPLPDGSFMTERGQNPWAFLDEFKLEGLGVFA